MSEPRWLAAARGHIGTREIKGRKHNPKILQWWTAIRAPYTDDETPWCAGFVGGVLESVGVKSSRSAAARSYLKWGVALKNPAIGCIVVFERGPRNGHVGFLVGIDQRGNLLILGGNQGDAVNIKPFPKARALGYRWPAGEPLPSNFHIERTSTNDAVSKRESFYDHRIEPKETGIADAAAVTGGLGVGGIAYNVWDAVTKAPDALLTAFITAASNPTFWVFVAVAVAAGAVIYWRYNHKKAIRDWNDA